MLPLKPAVLGSVFAAFVGATAVVVGCSADGAPSEEYVPTTEQKPTDPGSSVKLPPPKSNASSSSSGGDDGEPGLARDGGSSPTSSSTSSGGSAPPPAGDAGATGDGGASGPAPAVGASCSVIDQKFKKICGKCGAQESICVSLPDGTGGTVSNYGPCTGESTSATACLAGAQEDCGNCGKRTCSNTCGWGSCQNQGVCRKGTIQHDNAGCPVPGTWRSQTCTDTCGWSSLSASQCEEPTVVLPAVGDTSSTIWELKTTQTGKRAKSCKRTADLTKVTVFPVALKNPTNTDAVVAIWNSTPVPLSTTSFDTTITTYLRDTPPTTDEEYRACYTEYADSCQSSLQGICTADGGLTAEWAGVDNVTVPANSTLIVVTAGWTDLVKGKFVLNVKTKSH